MADPNHTNLNEVDWSQLPVPESDDGASHLEGMSLPSLSLPSTSGEVVDLSQLQGTAVVFAYPMTGRPDVALPEGWDMIPGARGCTPQACTFRDVHQELRDAGTDHLFGLSAQATDYQKEAAERLHLPFSLLSDELGLLRTALNLPVMEVEGMTLLKRLTMICVDGKIEKVFYPVFPPDQNPADVQNWLKNR